MTLDEAINHCKEKAKELRLEAEQVRELREYVSNLKQPYNEPVKACLECAEEHEQLAEWLTELKELEERPQGDLISREELKKAIETYDKFACLSNGKIETFRNLEHPEMFEPYVHLRDIRNAINNAPTVEPQNKWDKWVISEIQCPNCLEYFQTDYYLMEELQKCPNCGAKMK